MSIGTENWMTTSTMLDRLKDFGNGEVWARFADRFRRPVVAFAKKSGLSASDSEDVAQEAITAFAEAYRRGEYDRSKGRLSRWLFGIVHIHILRHRQKQKRRDALRQLQSEDSSFWGRISDARVPEQAWDEVWDHSLWETCVGQVREEFELTSYQAFELVVRDGLSAAHAAEQLNIPVKAVYNAKHRILKRLRELRDEIEEVL